jgi:hypothetical protein
MSLTLDDILSPEMKEAVIEAASLLVAKKQGPKSVYTVKELAGFLKMKSTGPIYDRINAGTIRTCPIDDSLRIPHAEVIRLTT